LDHDLARVVDELRDAAIRMQRDGAHPVKLALEYLSLFRRILLLLREEDVGRHEVTHVVGLVLFLSGPVLRSDADGHRASIFTPANGRLGAEAGVARLGLTRGPQCELAARSIALFVQQLR